MSAFICSHKHFASIEQAILRRSMSRDRSIYAIAYGLGFYPDRNQQKLEDGIKKLVQQWYRLNVETVCIKYGEPDDQPETFGHGQVAELGTIPLLKALQCLDYQIETEQKELNEEEKAAMHVLQMTISELQNAIVSETKDYRDAQWEIH